MTQDKEQAQGAASKTSPQDQALRGVVERPFAETSERFKGMLSRDSKYLKGVSRRFPLVHKRAP